MIVCLKEKLPSWFPLKNLVHCCKTLACQHLMNIKHDMEAQQRTSTCVAHGCICLNFTFSGLVQTNWDHVFSRLSTSTKSDICTFASKPDNVCTHCNRDCILFAQILKNCPPICCQGGLLTIGLLCDWRRMLKDVCAGVGRIIFWAFPPALPDNF